MPGQWAALVQSGKDLEKAFDDAVSHFNNQNAVALKNGLSPNVVLKKVGHPLASDLVLGAANVMTYIQQEWATDNPKFHPHGASKHVDPVLGSVHGVAEWDETKSTGTCSFAACSRNSGTHAAAAVAGPPTRNRGLTDFRARAV